MVAFYSNPRLPARVAGGKQLNALTREMRFVIHSMNPFDYHIEPATTEDNIKDALRRLRPSIVVFSAHSAGNHLIIENDDGSHRRITADTFATMLSDSYHGSKRTLLCVVILACDTSRLGQMIFDAFDGECVVICWKSVLVHDTAAAKFAMGFLQNVTDQLNDGTTESTIELDVHAAFDAACRAYKDAGYSFGDPKEWVDGGYEPRDIPVYGTPALIEHGTMVLPRNVRTLHPASGEELLASQVANMSLVHHRTW
jgi:Zn-finger protein